MRIVLLTTGHRGDVLPLIALGNGLSTAGHGVAVATPAAYRGLVTAHDLEHRALPEDPMLGAARDTGGRRRTAEALRQALLELLEACWEAARGAELLIAHPKTVAGPAIARALEIPLVVAAVTPSVTPTVDFPNPDGPALPLGGWYNLLSYRLAGGLAAPVASAIEAWTRQRLGRAEKVRRWRWHAKDAAPVLYAFSPLVVPRPTDWPPTTVVTGYWPLPIPRGWKPTDALAAFVNEEPAPIYVGFGSAPIADPRRFFERVVDACRRGGFRAVIDTSDSGIELPSGGGVFSIRDVPHRWLFEHARVVVHHGGAGTTGAGLLAGCPTVVCPFAGDQFFWARMVRDLGVGPDFSSARSLTSVGLAESISKAVSEPSITRSCAVLSAELAAEDGVGNAVRYLETVAGARAS